MQALSEKNRQITAVWDLLEAVPDPEIPVVSIRELGILRDVRILDDLIEVVINPTYSGCPAMQAIKQDILATLQQAGYNRVEIKTRLAPAWSSDWISQQGRRKLKAYGIAPPQARGQTPISCPQCDSKHTVLISEFGSTACKALYKCNRCLEPFDYFKCI